jgi:hypothetical protein
MNGYQPKKKVGMLHPKYKKAKMPRGGFGLEKVNRKDSTYEYGKLPNGGTLVKPCDSPPPPPPPSQPMVKFKNGSKIHSIDCNDRVRGQSASDLWMHHEILCHSCSNKDICKYQGDYLEQVVHIVDTYSGVFDLNCNHYKKDNDTNKNEEHRYYKVIWDEDAKMCMGCDVMLDTIESLHKLGKKYDVFLITKEDSVEVTTKIS